MISDFSSLFDRKSEIIWYGRELSLVDGTAERGSQVAPLAHDAAVEVEPLGGDRELLSQLVGNVCDIDARLGERARHAQHAGLPIGLEVDPGYQRVAEQERQHVVAVDPLG